MCSIWLGGLLLNIPGATVHTFRWGGVPPVSYTHLDVYKRQHRNIRVIFSFNIHLIIRHRQLSSIHEKSQTEGVGGVMPGEAKHYETRKSGCRA